MEVREPRKQGGPWIIVGTIVIAFALIATISGFVVRNFNRETRNQTDADKAATEKVVTP